MPTVLIYSPFYLQESVCVYQSYPVLPCDARGHAFWRFLMQVRDTLVISYVGVNATSNMKCEVIYTVYMWLRYSAFIHLSVL